MLEPISSYLDIWLFFFTIIVTLHEVKLKFTDFTLLKGFWSFYSTSSSYMLCSQALPSLVYWSATRVVVMTCWWSRDGDDVMQATTHGTVSYWGLLPPAEPLQILPPFAGGGWLQRRLRVFWPRPQCPSQVENWLHGDHCPSTGLLSTRMMWGNIKRNRKVPIIKFVKF